MLFDLYSPLLTSKQKEIFELRYHYDLSLGEIATNLLISRQAVNDLLRRVIGQLIFYENSLSLLAKEGIRQDILAKLEQVIISEDCLAANELIHQLKKL